ncbi:MAG: hypothetical protein NTU43_04780 [Bacteroidetes bacterium]|nr:hypothetical protein [Bacteroidota bacterium]
MLNNEEDNIDNYIKNKNNQGGFTTPDDYFVSMSKSILLKIEGKQLGFETRQGGFMIPDSFFENQKQIILNQTTHSKAKIIPFYNKRALKVASMAAMLMIVGFLFVHSIAPKNTDILANISGDEIINHLEKTDISEELICEVIGQNNFSKKDTDLEKYLDEHVDEDLLIDDL